MRILLILLTLISLATPALSADMERFNEGRRLAAEGRRDFAMIEFEAFLRNAAEDPKAREARFALAEYYFDAKNPIESRKNLGWVAQREDAMGLLASVYSLKLANAAESADLSEKLKAGLASKKMLVFFKKKRDKKWVSPLGNVYHFKESVDRMEILRNGSPFYEVTLP